MSSSIIVTGLPINGHFGKFMYSFKVIFKKIQIKKFWIQDLSEMSDGVGKQMTIEFHTEAEARKARNYLNNYAYPTGKNKKYVLSAVLANLDQAALPAGNRRQRPPKRPRPQARQRSPSPDYMSQASKLDMELELLRKQSEVLEQERRLLLERKKLVMIREYGPNASLDFMDYEDERPRKTSRKRHLPPPTMEVKKPRQRSPPRPKQIAPKQSVTKRVEPKDTYTLPAFFQPCKILIAEMKEFIDQNCAPCEKDTLIMLIRAALRKTLALALEDKSIMKTREVVKLYRELHPKTGDEDFVKKILANIRASYLPGELESKLARVKTEPVETSSKSNENPPVKKVGRNKVKWEGYGLQSWDNPANGHKLTDADSIDFTADITAEPISQKPNEAPSAPPEENKEASPATEALQLATEPAPVVLENATESATIEATEPAAVEVVAEDNNAVGDATEVNNAVDDATEVVNTVEDATESKNAVGDATEVINTVDHVTDDNTVGDATEINNAVGDVTEDNNKVGDAIEDNNADATEVSNVADDVTEVNPAVGDATEVNDVDVHATEVINAVEDATESKKAVGDATEVSNTVEDVTEDNNEVGDAIEDNNADATEVRNTVDDVTEVRNAVDDVTDVNTAVGGATEVNNVVEHATEVINAAEDATESKNAVGDVTEVNTAVGDVTEINTAVGDATEILNAVEDATEGIINAIAASETKSENDADSQNTDHGDAARTKDTTVQPE